MNTSGWPCIPVIAYLIVQLCGVPPLYTDAVASIADEDFDTANVLPVLLPDTDTPMRPAESALRVEMMTFGGVSSLVSQANMFLPTNG
ncbi:MAG: hypothetical protein MJZ10_14030 [Fibrobacter sp.]|nr:hypothetical protein [Fibrobacter sp.]